MRAAYYIVAEARSAGLPTLSDFLSISQEDLAATGLFDEDEPIPTEPDAAGIRFLLAADL